MIFYYSLLSCLGSPPSLLEIVIMVTGLELLAVVVLVGAAFAVIAFFCWRF